MQLRALYAPFPLKPTWPSSLPLLLGTEHPLPPSARLVIVFIPILLLIHPRLMGGDTARGEGTLDSGLTTTPARGGRTLAARVSPVMFQGSGGYLRQCLSGQGNGLNEDKVEGWMDSQWVSVTIVRGRDCSICWVV